MDGRSGSSRMGPLRSLGWLAGAVWWARQSPAGLWGLGAAAAPWVVLSLLNFPTDGLSMVVCVGFYAHFCAWSTMCALEHFEGRSLDVSARKEQWGRHLAQARSALSFAFVACAVVALAWAKICVDLSGIGEMLDQVKAVGDPEKARALIELYWHKDGLGGIVIPLLVLQGGLAVINAVWFSLPALSLRDPSFGARALLARGLRRVARAPIPMLTMGLAGVLLAQIGLVFAPAALLSGVWFCACAFAARDLDVDEAARADF